MIHVGFIITMWRRDLGLYVRLSHREGQTIGSGEGKRKRPKIAKRQKSAKNVLYTIVFNSSGPMVQIPSKERRNIYFLEVL